MADHEVTIIPADEVPSAVEEAATELIVREPWEDTLKDLANKPGKTLRVPRDPDLRRKQVVNAFQDAFALIGGSSYAKLMPKQQEIETKHEGGLQIMHVLPRGKLDE